MADRALRRPLFLLLLSAAAAVAAATAPAPSPSEYDVKAAFLYNFAKFVDWPPQAYREGGSFIICVLGDDPFGSRLDGMLAGKSIHDRSPVVKRISRAEEARGCQLLFVGVSEEERLGGVLAIVADTPVLTVGDMGGFAQRGGMIGFTIEDKKVRFAVNQKPAAAAGLRISSQCLKLAKIVE